MLVKILANVARWIFILCLPVMLFTASMAWGFNSLWLYKYGFNKFGVSGSTGIPPTELDRAAQSLIAYFNSNQEYVQVTIHSGGSSFLLFNEQEQAHFKDVKGLVRFDYKVLIGTLAFVLIFAAWALSDKTGRRRMLARTVIWGSALTFLLLIVLAVGSLFDFSQLFIDLHHLIFSNSYWSAEGYMLMMFPGDFWFDAALICFGFMAALAVVLAGLSFFYLRKEGRRERSSGG